MKKVSVVILNWNGAALMRRYLPSVVHYTPAEWAEVVVVDNGSTDDSIAMLEREFPTVKRVLLDQNYGFAGGYNRGIAILETPYCLLLNDDVAVSPGWLEPLVACLESSPDVAACQPKLKSDRDRSRFEYAGAAGGFLDRYGYPYCRGRIFTTVEEDKGQYDGAPYPIFWATGAALLVRRADYLAVGGLDETFFAHMEEIDLCWRLHRAGKQIYCVSDSEVYHLGGATLNMGSPRKTYLNFRNNLWMLYKNLPPAAFRRTLAVRVLLDGVAMLRFLLRGEWGSVGAVLRAYKDAHLGRSRYHDLPKENLLKTFEPGRRCIVWDYYARGKKHF